MPSPSILHESAFEHEICVELSKRGWLYDENARDAGWDPALALFPEDVLHWLSTQFPDEYEKAVPSDLTGEALATAQRKLLQQLAHRLDTPVKVDPNSGRTTGGLLGTLFEGFKYSQVGRRSASFKDMVAFPPAHPLLVSEQQRADENRLRVIRQVHFDSAPGANDTIDLVLLVNGIPVVTLELKTDNTQSVGHAIRQYREDRVPSPTRPLLWPGRALVHFAVTNAEVYMTTSLTGPSTRFLPFNQGVGEHGGNPANPNGSETSYLWEDVLSRATFLRILRDYAIWEPDDKPKRGTPGGKLIFPRFHQLRAVEKVTADVEQNGTGGRYLIEHSAGSGKTKTIAWLAHRLIRHVGSDGKKTFNSVIVITDRTVLDDNIRQDMSLMRASKDLVISIGERPGAKSPQLRDAIADGDHIITTTLQTFPFVLKLLEGDEELGKRSWCVIADEAHSSQTGTSAAALRELLVDIELDEDEDYTADDLLALKSEATALATNMTFVALTATPKYRTLQMFGTPGPDGVPAAFDTYPMGQAVEEGFIMDVLKNYSTYKMWAEIRDKLGRTEEVDQSAAVSEIVRFVRIHPTSIAQKVEVVVEHFAKNVAHLLDGQARAMVVTSSRKAAVRWSTEMNKYIDRKGYTFRSLVAFSGSVTLDEGPEDEAVTEVSLNGVSDVEKAFKDSGEDYRVLIVAEKFQTGFNEPRLCAMYVDKKLSGIATVQTLSRLNRTFPNKPNPMVVDFVNSPKNVQKDFALYYSGAHVDDQVDPNMLHELSDALDTAGFYDAGDMDRVAEAYLKGGSHNALRGTLSNVIQAWNNEMTAARVTGDKSRREHALSFRSNVSKYRHAWDFLSQIVAYADPELSKRAILCAVLERNLTDSSQVAKEDYLDGIALTGVAISGSGQGVDESISKGSEDPLVSPSFEPKIGAAGTPMRAAFDEVVEAVNDLFSAAGVDVGTGETSSIVVAAWGSLAARPVAVQIGRENDLDQLRRSKKFNREAKKAIMDVVDERKKVDALLSHDRDVLEGMIENLARLMDASVRLGFLDGEEGDEAEAEPEGEAGE
ncbi:type I restriction endonuclease subunit R [Corynebacterium sanguinis]|uniref:type I restriction endonuclease subunit R n=1 Tax=Corynebacterium sanguinis TaxID=2594913 RepID=UPI0011A5BE54|nr:type I restriction endonuclease [Corynebacterium sanguinis]TVS23110.1 type I restriction endonuclease subunit R [Corynebacterium sanguinis]